MKIAIIGMGAAGLSVLRELVAQLEDLEKYSITIYSDAESFGTGLPYQNDDESIILNQYAETMSLIPDDDLDFVNWVQKNKDEEDPVGKYLPRSWYGEYLLALLDKLLKKSKAVVKKSVVTSIRVTDDQKYAITTADEKSIVDYVDLATGHFAYQDPYDLKETEKYIHHPYPVVEKVKDILGELHVAILGTGLTAIDLMNYFRNKHPNMTISMVSPDGKFSSVRGPESEVELTYLTKERLLSEKEETGGLIPFETIKNWFIKEVEIRGLNLEKIWSDYGLGTLAGLRFDLDHLDTLGKFQSILFKMEDLYAEIWNALSEAGREEFLTNYAERFTAFRSPIPKSSAENIFESVEDGGVKIFQDIKDVKENQDLFQIKFTSSEDMLEVDYLLNSTGQSANLSENWHVQHTLIQQLLNERILTPYLHGGVQILYPEMSAISQRYGVLSSFKVYGQLVSGINYFNNTVISISKGAINGVESMV